MLLRIIAIILFVALLTGASSSSNSTFVLAFPSNSLPPESLVPAAVSALEQSGFHRVGDSTIRIELQYGQRPIWVHVSSSAPGQLQLSFEELRGGCSNIPEVAGAKDTIARVRSNLESQFGPAIVSEAHAANQRPQPNIAVEGDAPQAARPSP